MSKMQEFLSGNDNADVKYKLLEKFFQAKDKNINLKTDLTQDQIYALAVIDFVQETIKGDWKINLGIDKLSTSIKQLLVSKNRLGRSEAMMVLKGDEKKEEDVSALKKFLGM